MLTDPRIRSQVQTCFACPEQYEGELITGEYFYFRYRYGVASLYLSWEGVPRGPEKADAYDSMSVGNDSLSGIFESSEERNNTFKALLDRLDAMLV